MSWRRALWRGVGERQVHTHEGGGKEIRHRLSSEQQGAPAPTTGRSRQRVSERRHWKKVLPPSKQSARSYPPPTQVTGSRMPPNIPQADTQRNPVPYDLVTGCMAPDPTPAGTFQTSAGVRAAARPAPASARGGPRSPERLLPPRPALRRPRQPAEGLHCGGPAAPVPPVVHCSSGKAI